MGERELAGSVRRVGERELAWSVRRVVRGNWRGV